MNSLGTLAAAGPGKTEESARIRILVLDEYFPFPPNSGKPIRSWNLLRRLATRHDVTLLCHGHLSAEQADAARTAGVQVESVDAIAPDAGPGLYLKLLINLFSSYPYSVAKHYTARFRKRLDTLLRSGRYTALHCEWTPYARYALPSGPVPVVVATHNIESQIWHRRAQHAGNPIAKAFFAMQAAKMERFERRAFAGASFVTTVSASDKAQAEAWGAQRVKVVENGVDLERFTPSGEGKGEKAVFVGALDWFPNADALHYFAGEILPLLADPAPHIKTRVIGRNAPASLKAALSDKAGIDFLGEVPDTRPHLAEAGVVVVPLRIGGGSRLKILEAWAMGKAVVSTSIGAEGLEARDGQNIIIADTPEAFARAMTELSRSPQARKELGARGRQLVEEKYGWDAISLKAEEAWLETAVRGARV